ncbi:MAG: NAD-dependent malic enzyme [Pseudomonadota bacterium]
MYDQSPEHDPPLRGYALLRHAGYNKGTAFSMAERERFGLRGLLPARVSSQAGQLHRVLANLRRKTSDIERYIFLLALQGRNERLFYRLVIDNLAEIMPLIYTPTVGQACLEFAHIFRQPRGFYITPEDRGQIRAILDNWPERDVRLIVVTDGERILGLGDLGANGMGIPVGKLALYTACAGIPPRQCLPVMLDVGTDNETLRSDPLYLGTDRPRLRGPEYDALVEEFVTAVQDAYPRALLQFEDFLTPNAYTLLARYRDRVLCFNDDIQGTAAVTLACLLAASRVTGTGLTDLRILFLGAGSAATGIAELVLAAQVAAGADATAARSRLWLVNRAGLVVRTNGPHPAHLAPYAHDLPERDLLTAIRDLRPHVLIGATGSPGSFTGEIIRLMAELNERPVIFALSNPSSRAECTAEDAYRWSSERALFASGSPFGPVGCQDRTLIPGQANNAYVFPGIGLGALACQASTLSDAMFLAAARVLADSVEPAQLAAGTLLPPLHDMRRVSADIARAVAETAWDSGLAGAPRPADIGQLIRDMMYDPSY